MSYITTAEVKKLLGIQSETTTYDTDIALKIPELESTIKRMTHNKFTLQVVGRVIGGESKQSVFVPDSIYSYATQIYDGGNYLDASLDDCLYIGQTISGAGIPAGSFIQDIYSYAGATIDGVVYEYPVFTVSGIATETDSVTAYTGIPVGLKAVFSKCVFWMIRNQSTSFDDTAWTSRSVGPLSISRSELDATADGMNGLPAWFNKSIPRFHR